MLGRLGLDVETCIERYVEISQSVFKKPRSKTKLWKAVDAVRGRPKYQSNLLEAEIKRVVEAVLQEENAPLLEADSKPGRTKTYARVSLDDFILL